MKIDWNRVNKILNEQRFISENFIKKNLLLINKQSH